MVIVDNATGEPDVARLLSVLTELMEQTTSHRSYTAQLHAQAGGIKVGIAAQLTCFQMTKKSRPKQYIRKRGLC